MTEEPQMIVGVDLGQQRDYTAISVTERAFVPTGREVTERRYSSVTNRRYAAKVPEIVAEYRVRHLERPPLGTPYPKIVEQVVELVTTLGGEPALVVDATGVGRPVVDMLKDALMEALEGPPISITTGWITITGGDSVTKNPDGGLRVPKRDLISAALVLLQNGRLKIADALRLKDVLVREMLNFKVKINIATAHDSYEAWRKGDHDDLVLAVALSCWAGERFLRKPQLAQVYSF